RFKNEAQAAAALHHTNIVPIFSVGAERGVHYYAMQYIEGQTLADLIAQLRQRAGLARIDEWLTQVDNPPRSTENPAPTRTPPTATSAPLQALLSIDPSTTSPIFFRTVARLGVQAAEALEHAHQRGVVNRDIKPANLLVDATGHLWITD